jgi:phage-related protein
MPESFKPIPLVFWRSATGFHDGMLIALHAIIKKTQRTPPEELTVARLRFKELQSWHGKTRI